MEQVIATVVDQFGPIDILINNAAIITPLAYDWDIDPDEWWRTLEVNLYGPYLCTHLVLPTMIGRRWGTSSTCPASQPILSTPMELPTAPQKLH